MNRPGQPPQRPPSLGPTPALPGPFRGPYPYGMPPRNVLQGGYVPSLQPNNHRTPAQQAQIPQPTSGFMQQRQSGFPFGGTLGQTQAGQGQHQPSSSIQQHSSNPPASSLQQQSNGTSNSFPPHLTQNATTSNLGGTAPSVSSASDVGLDPNDFPALGSTPANANSSSNGNSGNNVTTSYASQAGTALGGTTVSAATGTGTGNNSQARDFTPDDFPALGGQTQSHAPNSSSQSQSQGQDSSHPHPPGLNGFQHNDHSQQHRQNLLGSLGGLQTPGMLNLGPSQARNVHPGFQQTQTEAEKQQQRNNYALKLNQATQAAWNSPNTNSASQAAIGASMFSNPNPTSTTTQQNGAHPTQSQNSGQPPSQSQQLNAPPGVPGPYTQPPPPPQENTGIGHSHPPGAIANTYASNGDAANPNSNPNPNPPHHPHATHPQTPAQQILMSAADRWGLLGLLQMIKNAGTDVDHGLSSIGTDLGTMGLDMGYSGNLYSTFITPWADQSAAHTVEPDFHLPACYNVQPPPPGPTKAAAFSDETLFFMFYSSPRDALQEVAAQELFQRNWRFHKELRLWITKEAGTSTSQKIPGGEQGTYTIWDPENWGKERKEMAVVYADLEEKSIPAFVQGPGLVLAQGTQGQGQGTGQQPHGQTGQVQGQLPPVQRGSFQTGIGGL